MNRIISLSVEDMYIKYTGEAFGATGSHNAVTLRMTFGPAWEGTAKTAYFTDALGNTSVALVLGLDTLVDGAYEVDVPSEALKAAGVATITIKGVLVSGETTTKAITTAAGHFRVLDSELPDSAGNAGTITPSEKDQLQAEIDGLETLFTTAKAAAEAAAANAKASETNAKASETAASGSASQASAAAAAAAQSAASVDGINKTAQSWAVGGTGTRPGEDTDNAKYWAKKAQAVVGGDFATKVEAQGYVTAHNESNAAHSDIRKALEGKAAATHASQHGKDGEDPITPAAIGAASLGADGKVPASQLPETDTYTKDEILKDATAAKFGKDTGAVPDEVLDILSAGVLHAERNSKLLYAPYFEQTGTIEPQTRQPISLDFVHDRLVMTVFGSSPIYSAYTMDGENWVQFTQPVQGYSSAASNYPLMFYAFGHFFLGWSANNMLYYTDDFQVWSTITVDNVGTSRLFWDDNDKSLVIIKYEVSSGISNIVVGRSKNMATWDFETISELKGIYSIRGITPCSKGVLISAGFSSSYGSTIDDGEYIGLITATGVLGLSRRSQAVFGFAELNGQFFAYGQRTVSASGNCETWGDEIVVSADWAFNATGFKVTNFKDKLLLAPCVKKQTNGLPAQNNAKSLLATTDGINFTPINISVSSSTYDQLLIAGCTKDNIILVNSNYGESTNSSVARPKWIASIPNNSYDALFDVLYNKLNFNELCIENGSYVGTASPTKYDAVIHFDKQPLLIVVHNSNLTEIVVNAASINQIGIISSSVYAAGTAKFYRDRVMLYDSKNAMNARGTNYDYWAICYQGGD